MSVMGLYGIKAKTKYKSYKSDRNGTVDNQLLTLVIDEENHRTYYKRNFKTGKCNEKWSTDVSEFPIAASKLYLSPIMDLYYREIVSYTISKSPNFKQMKDMLSKTFYKYPDLNGLIFQSDQEWQYQMKDYHRMLYEKGIIQSMSRKENCLDHSPIENFFGKMKQEMFDGKEYTFQSLEELKVAMEEYIEYYNTKRITVKLKGLTPVQYRNQSFVAVSFINILCPNDWVHITYR